MSIINETPTFNEVAITKNPDAGGEIMASFSKSRWGWHPIGSELFQKLKALHKHVWEQWYKLNQVGRQISKCSHNRTHEKGMYDDEGISLVDPNLYEVEIDWWKGCSYMTHFVDGKEETIAKRFIDVETSTLYKLVPEAGMIVRDFRAARVPRASMTEVPQLELAKSEIIRLYDEWIEGN